MPVGKQPILTLSYSFIVLKMIATDNDVDVEKEFHFISVQLSIKLTRREAMKIKASLSKVNVHSVIVEL